VLVSLPQLSKLVNSEPTKSEATKVRDTDDFLELVESLKGELGNKILTTVDMPSLYDELTELMSRILLSEEILLEQRQIIE
jgi:hypothetical protein